MKLIKELTVVKKAGFVSLARIVNWLGLLLSIIILARYLPPSEFAYYDQFWLIFNTFFPIISFAFTSSVYFFGSREDAGEYMRSIFWFLSVIGLIFMLVIFVLRFEIAKFLNNFKFYENSMLFAIFFAFSLPSLILDAILILKDELRKLFVITCLSTLAQVLVVVLAIAFGMGIGFIFGGLSTISFFRFFYTWYVLENFWKRDSKNVTLKNSILKLREILLFTFPLVIGHVGGLISRQVDKYIVAHNFSAEIYAIYTIGAKELPIVPILTSSFASAFFPEIVKLYNAGRSLEVVENIRNMARFTSLFVLPTFSFLFLFSKEFIVFLFSEKYIDSAMVFRVYLFFLPVRVLLYNTILSALGRQKVYMFVSLFEVALNVGLGLFLVNILGLIGPAIAVVISTYCEALFMLFFISMILRGIKVLNILPFKFMIVLLSFSLLLAIFCYTLSLQIQNLPLRLLWGGSLFVAVYVFAIAKVFWKI